MQYQYIKYKQTQKYKKGEVFKTHLNKSFNIGLPWWCLCKNPPASAGDMGLIPDLG